MGMSLKWLFFEMKWLIYAKIYINEESLSIFNSGLFAVMGSISVALCVHGFQFRDGNWHYPVFCGIHVLSDDNRDAVAVEGP